MVMTTHKTLKRKDVDFCIAGIQERLLMKYLTHINPNIQVTHVSDETSQDKWDFVMVSARTMNCLVESKVREGYSIMTHSTYFIEPDKYDFLLEKTKTPKAQKNGLKPIYVNFYKDGVVIFDLNNHLDLKFNHEKKVYKKTKNPSIGQVVKNFGLLHRNQSIEFIRWDMDLDLVKEKARQIFNRQNYQIID